MTHQKRLGEWGEAEARRYLETKEYVFMGRNFRVPEGEIDLVMQDGDIVVFIEVKTRTSDSFGTPEESVSREKRKRLIRAGVGLLARKGKDRRFMEDRCRSNRSLPKLDYPAP